MNFFKQAHHLQSSLGASERTDTFSQIFDDNRFIISVVFLALLAGIFWWLNKRAKKWLEENDRLESESSALDWLLGSQAQNPKTTQLRYSEQEFQEMVSRALDEIPEEFDKEWKNVVVTVSTDWLTDADKKRMGIREDRLVLGTYSGVSRTQGLRSESSRHVIVIYQPAIERLCGDDKELVEEQIRKTVLHELGHHLGMSHPRMREIGL
jgi:predicted Zn-dependent protease with MMP-like domain